MTFSCSSSLLPHLEVYCIDPSPVVQQHPDLSGSSEPQTPWATGGQQFQHVRSLQRDVEVYSPAGRFTLSPPTSLSHDTCESFTSRFLFHLISREQVRAWPYWTSIHGRQLLLLQALHVSPAPPSVAAAVPACPARLGSPRAASPLTLPASSQDKTSPAAGTVQLLLCHSGMRGAVRCSHPPRAGRPSQSRGATGSGYGPTCVSGWMLFSVMSRHMRSWLPIFVDEKR